MIFIAGNGGLAAEAEHFASELMGKFHKEVYIPCIALTSNTSLLTALANDMGFEAIFAHQLKVLAKKGDVFIALTTSQSKNIMKAVSVAKDIGMRVILMDGNMLKGIDVAEKQEYALRELHLFARRLKENIASRKSEP